jgi:hypothetical protein
MGSSSTHQVPKTSKRSARGTGLFRAICSDDDCFLDVMGTVIGIAGVGRGAVRSSRVGRMAMAEAGRRLMNGAWGWKPGGIAKQPANVERIRFPARPLHHTDTSPPSQLLQDSGARTPSAVRS